MNKNRSLSSGLSLVPLSSHTTPQPGKCQQVEPSLDENRVITLQYSVSVQPSCPCSIMRVNWPPWTQKRNHIKLVSPLPVSFSGGWTRALPAVPTVVLPWSLLTSDGYLKRVFWLLVRFPTGTAHLSAPTHPREAEVMHERSDWNGPPLWFMTWRSYRIPPVQGWFLLHQSRFLQHLLPKSV